MIYITIVIITIICVIIAIKIITPIVQKRKLGENFTAYLKKENLKYIESSNKELYDIKVITNSTIFYVKFVIVPSHSEIQINNQSTWEVKYGAGNQIGKVQPHKRYLSEIVAFMKTVYEEKNSQKVVIFSPTPKKIVKYINENEIDFVNSTTDVYGARITSIGKYSIFKNK